MLLRFHLCHGCYIADYLNKHPKTDDLTTDFWPLPGYRLALLNGIKQLPDHQINSGDGNKSSAHDLVNVGRSVPGDLDFGARIAY